MLKKIIPCLAVLGTCCCACETPKTVNYPKAQELPVSRVVMYQSGIGYVERNAVVDGNELVLRIRPDQINDILKSLTVIDRGDGRPVSISLPVDKNTLDTLAQIPEQVQEGGIRSLLSAFRGAHVKVRTRNGAYEGRIVGIDEKNHRPWPRSELSIVNTEKEEDNTTLTLKTSQDVLEIIALKDIKSVSLYDKSLADGLDKSLNISLNDGSWKQIELRIQMDSDKKRELALSYLVAMPTWKPAYRLILEDNDRGTLQGWAVVSNVTGADWKDISFSLVSGQPMSFTYDLYRPQFLERPDLSGLAAQRAVAPKVMESGYGAVKQAPRAPQAEASVMMNTAKPAASATMAKKSRSMGGRAIYADTADMAVMEDAIEAEEEAMVQDSAPIEANEMINSFTELASKAQIGSFDEYKLASKLTIPDGNTALVNLIQENLTARDTRMFTKPNHIWSFDDFPKNWRQTQSFQTIELKNEANVALDSGPITIYRDSAVIGEGYLSRTNQDATAYITFANEGRLAVELIDTKSDTSVKLDSVKNGRCSVISERLLTQEFKFESHIQNATTALLQLPMFSNWTPVNFPENVIKNDSGYMISVQVPANHSAHLPLTMRHETRHSSRLNTVSGDCSKAVETALNQNLIPEQDVERFKAYLNDIKALDMNGVKTQSLQERRNEIERDQRSLSETLRDLKDIKSSGADSLKSQLMKRQKDNEKALVDITTELYALQVQKGEIELRMKEYETLSYQR